MKFTLALTAAFLCNGLFNLPSNADPRMVGNLPKMDEELAEKILYANISVPEIKKLILAGAHIEGTEAYSPVIMAATQQAVHGHPEALNFLLSQGANLNVSSNGALTPLLYAVDSCNKSVVQKLLRHGAEPDYASIVALEPRSPLDEVKRNSSDRRCAGIQQILEAQEKANSLADLTWTVRKFYAKAAVWEATTASAISNRADSANKYIETNLHGFHGILGAGNPCVSGAINILHLECDFIPAP